LKYAVVFTLLAILLASGVFLSVGDGGWFLAAFEAYASLGLFAMAVAYGLKQAGMPVEDVIRHPRWAPGTRLLLLPYASLAWLALAVIRRVDKEAGMSRVAPGLHVGRLPSSAERRRLAENGIDAVLDLCAEFPRRRTAEGGSVYRYIPILDGSSPSDRQLGEALCWIEARRAEGKIVLVHCAQGHGRSAIIAASALCQLGLASGFDEALAQIQSIRPRAKPSKGQRTAAIRFLESIKQGGNAKGAGLSTRPFS
jgi:protein-tyrosine phosphatase